MVLLIRIITAVCLSAVSFDCHGVHGFTEDLRLVDNLGNSNSSVSAGRLEVNGEYITSPWSSVCGIGFSFSEADIACRVLGFKFANRFGSVGALGFTRGSGSSRSLSCFDNGCVSSDNSNCSHDHDVALQCTNGASQLRLVSETGRTANVSAGRLEMNINGRWGTVCADLFTAVAANIACRQLGFPNDTSNSTPLYLRYHVTYLGFTPASPSVPIWFNFVKCNENDTDLRLCKASVVGVENCDHSKDVGLSCVNPASSLIRLVSETGKTANVPAGRLEVFMNGEWGTVCENSFDMTDAAVACRQLGFSIPVTYGNVGTLGYPQAESSVPTLLNNLSCSDDYSNIIECPTSIGPCSHKSDVALSCLGRGVLRLVSPSSAAAARNSSGRLEVYWMGQWGTVTVNSDFFQHTEAQVACRQLGFNFNTNYGSVTSLGFSSASSSTPTWFSYLNCIGSEQKLMECTHQDPLNPDKSPYDFDHNEDVALICSNTAIGVIVGSVVGGVVLILLIGGIIVGVCVCVTKKLYATKNKYVHLPTGATQSADEPAPTDSPEGLDTKLEAKDFPA